MVLLSTTTISSEIAQFSQIALYLISIDQNALQLAIQRWTVELQAYITCEVENSEPNTTVNLTSTYNYLLADGSIFKFLGRNATTKASLYWGETLLSMYWLQLTAEMAGSNGNFNNPDLYKGWAGFNAKSPLIQDIQSLDFWDVGCVLVPFSAFVRGETYDQDWCGVNTMSALVHGASFLRDIWMPADSLTKAFYSTVLTDLGQTDSRPNVLVDADLLPYYTRNFTNITKDRLSMHIKPESKLGIRGFSAFYNIEDVLGALPSVFSTSYLCSAPKRKSFGSLTISILVADLVFLQALWRIYTLGVGAYLSRRYPQMNRYEGHE